MTTQITTLEQAGDTEPTMTSNQLAELLGYEKKEINRKIKSMFLSEIDGGEISPSLDSRGYVEEYHLNELYSTMFVGKWHTPFLRQLSQFWIDKGKSKDVMQLPNFNNPAEAARAWAERYESEQLALTQLSEVKDYSERQTKYIGVLEDQHAKGITCPQFTKELNGTNVQQIQNFLSKEKNWMRKDKGGWNATSYARDKYLSVKYIEGHDGVSRPTCYLTEKGATLLYKYYCKQELPMKKSWNGKITPQCYLPIIGTDED